MLKMLQRRLEQEEPMKRLAFAVVSVISLIVIVLVSAFVSTHSRLAQASAGGSIGSGGGTPGTASNFTLVGHDPLFNRGMNAALAIFDHFVYIGNRTDGSDTCNGGGDRWPPPPPRGAIVGVGPTPPPPPVGGGGAPLRREVWDTSR